MLDPLFVPPLAASSPSRSIPSARSLSFPRPPLSPLVSLLARPGRNARARSFSLPLHRLGRRAPPGRPTPCRRPCKLLPHAKSRAAVVFTTCFGPCRAPASSSQSRSSPDPVRCCLDPRVLHRRLPRGAPPPRSISCSLSDLGQGPRRPHGWPAPPSIPLLHHGLASPLVPDAAGAPRAPPLAVVARCCASPSPRCSRRPRLAGHRNAFCLIIRALLVPDLPCKRLPPCRVPARLLCFASARG